jgi:hypothetical protein
MAAIATSSNIGILAVSRIACGESVSVIEVSVEVFVALPPI